MQSVFRLLFHTLPLLPIYFGMIYLGIACFLTVGLWYIKTFKITEQMADLEDKGLKQSQEYNELLQLRNRWAYLTYVRL